MMRSISATEARKRFGELIQEVQQRPVIVKRSGKPVVIVLSFRGYQRLVSMQRAKPWQELVNEAREQVKIDLKGEALPDPALVLREIRQERNDQ
jgi:prevent-host-death family protein